MEECYIGLGGNRVNTFLVMQRALHCLCASEGIDGLETSRLYKTTPVSDISQPLYLNAVCRFHSTLPLQTLWEKIQAIELEMGKVPKAKNAPRLIDLDFLFYGSKIFYSSTLIIPHPRWHERLFVLAPLADLTDVISLSLPISVKSLLEQFPNPHQERVTAQNSTLPYAIIEKEIGS